MVYWYVDGQPVGDSDGDVNVKEAYFSFSNLPGSVFGTTYNIKAVAQGLPDENNNIDSDTENYSLTVYTVPVTRTMTGGWTMAQMSVSVNVGWNGTTAEISAEASIKSYSSHQIIYGFNLLCSVVRLTPEGNWAADVWKQPEILFEGGFLQAEEGSFDSTPPYSKPESFDGSRLAKGHPYRVQAEITATAQHGDDKKNIDELIVSDSEDLFIPFDQ